MFRLLLSLVILTCCVSQTAFAQKKLTREQAVRKDKQDFARNKAWIYDDLDEGMNQAAKTKRPMVIVFR